MDESLQFFRYSNLKTCSMHRKYFMFNGKLSLNKQGINQRSFYSKTCLKRPHSKRPKIGFQDQLSLNAGKKYCRMVQGEHSAILFNLH